MIENLTLEGGGLVLISKNVMNNLSHALRVCCTVQIGTVQIGTVFLKDNLHFNFLSI